MAMWIDIACVLFTCVCVNHLGLIRDIECICHTKLYVINCPKCLSFWTTLGYGLVIARVGVIHALAISFLCAYLAIWIELGMGIVDLMYERIYYEIYKSNGEDDKDSTNGE